jgi:hypothetical protein
VYVTPPVAVNTVDDPLQIATSFPALIGAFGRTVTVAWSVDVHPNAVPVIVYVVVVPGVNVTVAPVVPLKLVAGDHEYVVAPVAVNVAVAVAQIVASLTTTTGNGFTVTTTWSVLIHPFAFVPVTVYVPVDAGVNAVPFVTTGDHV